MVAVIKITFEVLWIINITSAILNAVNDGIINCQRHFMSTCLVFIIRQCAWWWTNTLTFWDIHRHSDGHIWVPYTYMTGTWKFIGSVIGLSHGWRQTINWTNAQILCFGPLVTNFCEILIEMNTFSFTKMHLKFSSAKWWPFCFGSVC